MTWPWAGTLAMSIDDIWRPLGSFDPVPVVFITMARESIALRRPYRSNLRARQAEQTRTRIIAAAAELFAADGYARTTLAKIAAAAGVSTETVQGQGAKAALMIAAVEYVSVGVAGEESVLNLDLGRQLLAAPTVGTALDIVVDEQTAAHERSARLAQALIGAAAVDSELDRYLADLTVSVTGQSRRILEVYRGRGAGSGPIYRSTNSSRPPLRSAVWTSTCGSLIATDGRSSGTAVGCAGCLPRQFMLRRRMIRTVARSPGDRSTRRSG